MTNTSVNRKRAIAVLNYHIESLIGLSLSDLPDTCEVADTLDELESAFDESLHNPRVQEILIQIDLDWISELIYG
jgi:hypothetical protein